MKIYLEFVLFDVGPEPLHNLRPAQFLSFLSSNNGGKIIR